MCDECLDGAYNVWDISLDVESTQKAQALKDQSLKSYVNDTQKWKHNPVMWLEEVSGLDWVVRVETS